MARVERFDGPRDDSQHDEANCAQCQSEIAAMASSTLVERLRELSTRHRNAERDMRARQQNSLAAFEADAAQAMEEAAAHIERLEADARRYEWLKGQFKVMSPHMDGQHHWHLAGMSKFKGSSIDAICDAALSAQRGGE